MMNGLETQANRPSTDSRSRWRLIIASASSLPATSTSSPPRILMALMMQRCSLRWRASKWSLESH